MNQGIGAQRRGIMLVSLGSSIMTVDYLAAVAEKASAAAVRLEICFLAEPEVTNIVVLEGLSVALARRRIALRCETLSSRLRSLPMTGLHISKWGDYEGAPGFSSYVNALNQEFINSQSFNNHCCNQVFRNLQPVLRRHGIVSKRNEMTSTLAKYLLQELALKLYVANEDRIDVEFAPEAEMEVVESIYDGKYPQLNRLAKRRSQHFIVPPLEL